MTIQVVSVQALKVIVESTFASDATSSPGVASFAFVPANENSATLTITQDELDPNFNVQSRFQGRERVLGKKSATLKFTINLAPTGTAAGNATASVTSALGILLKATMGNETLDTGTKFSTGWTAITGDVLSGSGITAGNFIGWTNSGGVVEWRQVKSRSSNTITLSHGFSGAPANNDICYACAGYSFAEDPSQSLQFIVYGQNTNDRWLVLGCQAMGGFEISVDPSGKAIPTITFNFSAANWLTSAQTAASITGTIPTATYSAYSPIVGYAGEFRMFTVGTPTLATTSRIHVSAITWKPKVAFVPVTSPSGTQTIYRWRGSRANPPVEGTFSTFMEDLTWWTGRTNLTDYCQQYTMGTAAGSAVILSAPTCQVLNPQRAASDQEIEGQTISFAGRMNSDTALTTELATSPVFIGLG